MANVASEIEIEGGASEVTGCALMSSAGGRDKNEMISACECDVMLSQHVAKINIAAWRNQYRRPQLSCLEAIGGPTAISAAMLFEMVTVMS